MRHALLLSVSVACGTAWPGRRCWVVIWGHGAHRGAEEQPWHRAHSQSGADGVTGELRAAATGRGGRGKPGSTSCRWLRGRETSRITHSPANCHQRILRQAPAEESRREPKTLHAGNHYSQQLLFLNIGCSPYLPAGTVLSGALTADASLAFCEVNLLF